MKRVAHLLQRNETSHSPEQIVFFDTETIPGPRRDNHSRQEFRLCVALYWRTRPDHTRDQREWFEFTDPHEIWNMVCGKVRIHSTLYLVAHNLGFDLMTSRGLTELASRGWLLTMLYERGDTRIVKWGLPNKKFRDWLDEKKSLREFKGQRWSKTIQGIDNCNLFHGSIEQWGQSLGFPKLKMPEYSMANELWWPYCRRDVEIMDKLWVQWRSFRDEHKMGGFRCTLGSQAFSAFRHTHMHNKIELHVNEAATRLEREAYYGGRTEAFYVGEVTGQTIYKLDLNSQYPAVMAQHTFPTRLKSVVEHPSLVDLGTALRTWGVIADVLIDTPVAAFPERGFPKNLYPTGEFRTTLSTPELQYALGCGWIRDVKAMATYAMRPIFRWYVNYFYSLKQSYDQSGDKLRRSLVKQLLNSLYGKFGQRDYEDRLIGTCPVDEFEVMDGRDADSHSPLTIYRVGGSVIEQTRGGEGYNSFVGIAAHVTAHARLLLWSLIIRAGQHNVYYCDTDSLFVNKAGFDNLADFIHPDRLGYLKLEGTSENLRIRAPKDYEFGEEVVKKGIRSTAVEVAPDVFEQEQWGSLKTHIRQDEMSGFVNDWVTKHLLYAIDWGEKGADGWVTPYHRGISQMDLI